MTKIDHTPSTDDVRLAYANHYAATIEYHEEGFAEFNRWLAAHDAELTEKVRAEMADSLRQALPQVVRAWEDHGGNIETMLRRDLIDGTLAALDRLTIRPERKG